MRIVIEKNVVNMTPESAEEKVKMEALWRILIDCNDSSRKMVPIGEYVPAKNNGAASFYIEGLDPFSSTYTKISVESDCRCYCRTCNKLVDLKKGDPVPICCGKLMEIID